MSVRIQRVGGARDSCHGKQRVFPFYRISQFADSEEFDFRVWFSTRFLSLHRATKIVVGSDFAVTLSSPESVYVLFDITSEHSAELKWLMLNQHKRWYH